jgi:hypothetical protein
MRQSHPPVLYLVGPPKGRLSQLENQLRQLPWQEAREGVEVKWLAQEGEGSVLAQSEDRVHQERGRRRRQRKGLWKRLHERQARELTRDALLMKLGAAKQRAPGAWRLVKGQWPKGEKKFQCARHQKKLRQVRQREGRHLWRSNMPERPAAELGEFYLPLAQVEPAFKHLKGDLGLRPFHHQKQERIEAHIFIAFLAYCLHVTRGRRLQDLAPGLTARPVLEKLAAMPMIGVHLPTTDEREVILTRSTQPEPEQRLLLEKLRLKLPEQPPPKITAPQLVTK